MPSRLEEIKNRLGAAAPEDIRWLVERVERLEAKNAGLIQTLDTCAKHFDLLAKLASATRIGDKHKRPKWQIIADESNVGAAHIRALDAFRDQEVANG